VVQKKPKASRDKSSEIFLLGRGLKNPIESRAILAPEAGDTGNSALDI